MSEFEADVLDACLEEAYAWRHLHDPHLVGSMTAEEVLGLAKRAGYSEEVAQKMSSEHGWWRLQHDLPT